MILQENPFLYNLLKSKIMHQSIIDNNPSNNKEDGDDRDSLAAPDLESDDDTSQPNPDEKEKVATAAKIHRAHVISLTICYMLTFATNQRKNSMQIENSLCFLACGVSDWVIKFLNFVGLCSSRKTAHSALRTLGDETKRTNKQLMKRSRSNSPQFGPLICIDNLDFQQSVHVKSVDNQNAMFHGTWGYLHQIHPNLLASVDPNNLSLKAYKKAIAD
ncbi:hypothetical protein PCANC_18675 [Puccinia coronata f. sp. avenae]|uniref:Uncharacterized protein n=1 Tax=Puccinia coronata f. sp. avenae TaxID=200324 RepID=A0A2N5VCA8_9BASI|nr:hypothetical protein PCANC_18675 [Puccinia coronata f. sp. avenae]